MTNFVRRASALVLSVPRSPLRISFLAVEVVQLRAGRALPEEDPPLDPPWKNLTKLVACVSASRDCKDIVKLFERAFLVIG